MANIFADTEVPRWLQEDARPASGKEIGQTLEGSLATMLTSLQSNEKLGLPAEAGPLDRLQQAAFETRMNQQDPMWKAKWELTKRTAMIGQQSKWMQMGLASAKIDNYQSGLAAKAKIASDFAQDQNDINAFTQQYGNNPQDLIDNGPELFGKIRTQQGRILASKMFEGAKASTDHITATNAGTLDRQTALKAASEFTKQLAALDVGNPEIGALYAKIKKEQTKPLGDQDTDMMYQTLATAKARQAAIEAENAAAQGLTESKRTSGPSGTRKTFTAPTKTALEKAQAYRDSLDPDEDAGAWKEADAAVKKLTINPLDVLAARQVDRLAYDKQRQEDRLKIMGQAQQYKIDFAKMQQEAKAKVGAKGISEQQFIDRHINATRSSVEKNWDTEALGPVNTQKALAEATTLLKRTYRWTNASAKEIPNSNIQHPENNQTPSSNAPVAAASGPETAPAKKLTYNPESDTFE